jgi:hypothetical protein
MASVFSSVDAKTVVNDALQGDFARTDLCHSMMRFGSDKGGGWHNYTPVYHALFEKARTEPIRLFEVGLGTTDPTIASNMGSKGLPGASVLAWREYFPAGKIYGADVDKNIAIQMDRIKTFYVDQFDRTTIRDMWSQPELRENFDIIVDDGHHSFGATSTFMEESLHKLKPGGLYIVEDLTAEAAAMYEHFLKPLSGFFVFVSIVDIPHKTNTHDNRLVIIHKLHRGR